MQLRRLRYFITVAYELHFRQQRRDRAIFDRLQYIYTEGYTVSDADIAAPAIVQFVLIFYADMEKTITAYSN